MTNVFVYYADERRGEWVGQEGYFRHRERLLFELLHQHAGHWVNARRIEMVFWPSVSPFTSRNIISIIFGKLRGVLSGTSCDVESAHTSQGMQHLGYRFTG